MGQTAPDRVTGTIVATFIEDLVFNGILCLFPHSATQENFCFADSYDHSIPEQQQSMMQN